MATVVVSIATFALGLVLGHWLALGRDKRKEFNEAALPIRDWLLFALTHKHPFAHHPTDLQLDTFANCLGPRQRREFEHLFEDWKRVCRENQQQDETGQIVFQARDDIGEATEKLLPFTERR